MEQLGRGPGQMASAGGVAAGRGRRRLLLRGLAFLGLVAGGAFIVGLVKYQEEASAPPYDPATTALYFVELGAGPRRMLLLHGLAASSRYWTGRVGPLLGDHRLLVPDLLGFGESPKPRARYDLHDHLAALERLVRARGFDGGHALVVGHSLGAVVALALLGQHPGWFDGAVLIAPPVFRGEADALAQLGRHSWMERGTLTGVWWVRASHYVEPLFRQSWLAPLFGLPPDVYLDSLEHTWNSISGTLRETLAATDFAQLLARAGDRPILFVHGERDDLSPVELTRALAGGQPHTRFAVVPGADHQVVLDDPARVWTLVREFERAASPP
jgi:pimeloyl-ACP methyl ester carboxylesterase